MHYFFITGTSSGIGASLARELLQQTHLVHGFSRRGNDALVEESIAQQYSYADHRLDLTGGEALGYLLQLWKRLPLDTATSINLIWNAGDVDPVGLIGSDIPIARIQQALSLNLEGPMVMTQVFVQHLRQLDIPKRILFISSGAGRKPYPGWSTYCTAKAGMDMFAQVLATEQATEDFPFLVSSLAPGVVDTEMQAFIRGQNEADFPRLQRFLDLKSTGKLWSAEFVATHIAQYLFSEAFGEQTVTDLRDWVSDS